MSKHDPQPQELNTDTYRTGVTPSPKRSSGLIAVLLVIIIFLGGLASVLGILNIRLLEELMNRAEPTVPLNISTDSTGSSLPSQSATVDGSNVPAPSVPSDRTARLHLKPLPSVISSMDRQMIYSSNRKSLVTVSASTHRTTAQGIGVVISQDGYILTNAHFIDNSSRIFVTTSQGSIYRASLVGTDTVTDLAVLYIDAADLTPATFGDSALLSDAQAIHATCTEDGLHSGIITSPDIRMFLGQQVISLVQTTLGCCEGPIFNSYGQIVGFHSHYAPQHFGLYADEDLGFAIPSVAVKEITNQLLSNGFVAGRPTLGIETEAISKVYQQYWDLPGGLRLLEVSEHAMEQGIQPGDILMALDGLRLTTPEDLHAILFSGTIGQSLTAVVFRDGNTFTTALTIFDTVE